MRVARIAAVLEREIAELLRNRLLLLSILGPPVVIVIGPVILGKLVAGRRSRPGSLRRSSPGGRNGRRLTRATWRPRTASSSSCSSPDAAGVHPALDRDLLDHRREAEPDAGGGARHPDPDRGAARRQGDRGGRAGDRGRAHRVLAFAGLVRALYGPALFAIVSASDWLAATFLLGPAIALLSVVLGVLVSSRANDPRTAQQVGAVIVVPLVGAVIAQAAGRLFVDATGYGLAALAVLLVALAGLRAGSWLFAREAILTRWR